MLKKRELDLFFEEVPPHHNTDALKVRKIFDLMNDEPRPLSYLAEKTDWQLANLTRYLKDMTYKDYVEQIGSLTPRLWRLREDAIRLKITGYDAEIANGHLVRARDETSPGNSYDPVSYPWFKAGWNYFPYFPKYQDLIRWEDEERKETGLHDYVEWGARNELAVKSEKWMPLNGWIHLDPFVTVCYIMSNIRGTYKSKLRRALEECEAIHGPQKFLVEIPVAPYADVIPWFWTWQNLMEKNYTFFERNFSYLPSLWNTHVQEEYGLRQCVDFIINWMEKRPVPPVRSTLPKLVEDLYDA